MQAKPSTIERFWAKVRKTDGCWEWTGSRVRPNVNRPRHRGCGYGLFKYDGRIQGTHRISWQMTFGPIPKGFYVCHHCDNPACVRPDHLFVGTNSDNQFDFHRKGRRARPTPYRGELSHAAKLRDQDVRDIRALRASSPHLTLKDIGRRHGISMTSVIDLLARRTWAHVA